MKFSGVTILQGVEFSIFPIDFEWALQQCSATALPVIHRRLRLSSTLHALLTPTPQRPSKLSRSASISGTPSDKCGVDMSTPVHPVATSLTETVPSQLKGIWSGTELDHLNHKTNYCVFVSDHSKRMDVVLPHWQLMAQSADSDETLDTNLTSKANLTSSPTADHVWLQQTLSNIRMTFLPIIVAGTITNCLNFVVLSHREMRTVSTAVYLLALAVADLGVMYLELFRVWFEWTHLVDPALYFNDTYCRAVNYANSVARDYSNWLIACVTLERLAMIASPHRAKYFCTPQTVYT